MPNNQWNLKKLLKDSNCRLTDQRQEILRILAENRNRHFSAKEIYDLLKERDAGIGLSTVYRTLPLLEELKLAYRIHLNDGHMRYQYSTPEERYGHHHLICKNCGAILDSIELIWKYCHKSVKNKKYISGHSSRVADMSYYLAKAMGLKVWLWRTCIWRPICMI